MKAGESSSSGVTGCDVESSSSAAGSSGAIHDGIAPSAAGSGAGGGSGSAAAAGAHHCAAAASTAGSSASSPASGAAGGSSAAAGSAAGSAAASDAADDARERDAAGDPTDAGDRDARDDAGDPRAAGGGAPAGNDANKPFAGFSVDANRRASSTRARNRFSCVFKEENAVLIAHVQVEVSVSVRVHENGHGLSYHVDRVERVVNASLPCILWRCGHAALASGVKARRANPQLNFTRPVRQEHVHVAIAVGVHHRKCNIDVTPHTVFVLSVLRPISPRCESSPFPPR